MNTYFVSKAASELGLKVALSGLGGDELFGGYPSFRDVPRWVKACALPGLIPGLGRLVRRAASPVLPGRLSPKTAGLVEYGATYPGAYMLRRGLFMPWELRDLLGEETTREGLRRLAPLRSITDALRPCPRGSFARVATLEASLYMRNQLLRDSDWASMCHSLEIRTPLVDAQLLKALAPALVSRPPLGGKRLLANSPAVPLPASVAGRRKTGFVIPVGRWIETNGSLDVWRKVPSLIRPGIHWARRWAYIAASPEAAA
ncbi:MAG TPA: asparagine synthase C-terminal domain-containing protein [Chloroflexia bacterium]|nr:asparagine synthase C-terminal domain-containing protein [Chloroflexia bacterium]